MSIYGYHRTSTEEQHLDRGVTEITNYCNENGLKLKKILTDQQTGKNFNRPKYLTLKEDILSANDVLIVTELDRLGRDKESTLAELRHFKDMGVRIMCLEIPTTLMNFDNADTDNLSSMMLDTINNLLIELYATLAHAEMRKREKRQREGIAAKKARGEWGDYGRPEAINYKKFSAEYRKVIEGTLKPFECMRLLEMKKATFYKYASRYKNENIKL